MKTKLFSAFLVLVPLTLNAAVNVDSIFFWDNDRGISRQMYPAIGMFLFSGANWSSIALQDSRYGDFDIYMRYIRADNYPSIAYNLLSIDPLNEFQQVKPDIECNPYSRFVTVWEESLYIRGREQPTAIYARRFSLNPFMVYGSSAYTSKNPSVACRANGWFVVSFTRDFKPPDRPPAISCVLFDSDCNPVKEIDVRVRDSLWRRAPISRVAFCDSGFVVVYEDSSKDGSQRSIYLSYFRSDGLELKRHIKVSNLTSDAANEERPAVSVDPTGYGVIVWEDNRNSQTAPDIYGRTFQMKPEGSIYLGSEIPIDVVEVTEETPRVTMLSSGDFFVVYGEKRTDYDIIGRAFLGGSLKPRMVICGDSLDQLYPDIDARKNCDTFGIVWHSIEVEESRLPGTFYDVRCRFYWNNKEVVYPVDTAISFVPDTSGGRRGWYFDDEDYDNPLTAWNEDPIDEPDSQYVDLDFAIMDQLMELNTNNQYFITMAETLPYRKQQKELSDYEAIFMDLGYRTGDASAGTMTQEERDALYTYYRSDHPTMIEGNDFGYYYDTTLLFKSYGAEYRGDGVSYLVGNVDTLYGWEGSFKDLTLPYDYQSAADNYVDSIRPTNSNYELILASSGAPTDWIAGRCVGWGTYWKDGTKRADAVDSFTVYSSCMLSSIKSGKHPNTYAEIYRRLLGFLGLTCQPAPVVAFLCSTYTGTTQPVEGGATLRWEIVSDNTPTESAEGPYKLKYSKSRMSSETDFDNANTYYQIWNTKDSAVGHTYRPSIFGLPPMDTLIFALKASDEDTLWSALGAIPRCVVSGDSVTPHVVMLGSTYGYAKDFSNRYEYINRRRKNDTGSDYDSLFVTWNSSNNSYNYSFYAGFSRCDLRTEGDMFIYLDTKSGGADSTIPYSGTTYRSRFFKSASDSFRPDYCLVLENYDSVVYYRVVPSKDGRAGTWDDSACSWSSYYFADSAVNNFMYNEVRILFSRMSYTAGNTFKLVVLVDSETTNHIVNAYPIFNPLGSNSYITQYYSWGAGGLQAGIVPARRGIIGIEEADGVNQPAGVMHLTVMPNPFTGKTKIFLPAIYDQPVGASLKIYDVTGRLVKKFSLLTTYSATQYGGLLPTVFSWSGTDDNGQALPGGIYFCEYVVANKKEAIKIIYIK